MICAISLQLQIYENGRLCSFLDASDENGSSWMRFIQCARHKGEQNLYVFQYYRSIYYRAFKDIPVGSELMVWYDEKYPHFFGLPMEIRDMSSCSVESKTNHLPISSFRWISVYRVNCVFKLLVVLYTGPSLNLWFSEKVPTLFLIPKYFAFYILWLLIILKVCRLKFPSLDCKSITQHLLTLFLT